MLAVEHRGISDRESSQLLASFVFHEIYIIWSRVKCELSHVVYKYAVAKGGTDLC